MSHGSGILNWAVRNQPDGAFPGFCIFIWARRIKPLRLTVGNRSHADVSILRFDSGTVRLDSRVHKKFFPLKFIFQSYGFGYLFQRVPTLEMITPEVFVGLGDL